MKFTVIYFLLCFCATYLLVFIKWTFLLTEIFYSRKEIFKQRCILFSNNLKLFYLANIHIVWFVRSKFVLFCNTTRNIKWKLYTGLLLGKSRGPIKRNLHPALQTNHTNILFAEFVIRLRLKLVWCWSVDENHHDWFSSL